MKQYLRFKKWVEQKRIQNILKKIIIGWIFLILIFIVVLSARNGSILNALGISRQVNQISFPQANVSTSTKTPIPIPTLNFKKGIIILTNNERKKAGLNDLIENDLLDKVAEEKANDLIDRNYWAHFAPNEAEESTWKFIKNLGYNYLYAGENLARGYSNASDIVSAWMVSEKHKKNILDSDFKDVGVYAGEGVLTGAGTIVVVQEFETLRGDSYQGSISQNQGLSIDLVKSYRDRTIVVNNSWISARNRFPTDKLNQLVDSFTRQIAFSDQIISDYEKKESFSNDNFALWQAVIKMGNESNQLTNELNHR